jgi:hypothetical protein
VKMLLRNHVVSRDFSDQIPSDKDQIFVIVIFKMSSLERQKEVVEKEHKVKQNSHICVSAACHVESTQMLVQPNNRDEVSYQI